MKSVKNSVEAGMNHMINIIYNILFSFVLPSLNIIFIQNYFNKKSIMWKKNAYTDKYSNEYTCSVQRSDKVTGCKGANHAS